MEHFPHISSHLHTTLQSSQPYLQATLTKTTTYLHLILSLLNLSSPTVPKICKATPGTPSWPSPSQWSQLNDSLSGKLILSTPPGAVCHPSHPSFSPLHCPSVQTGWKTAEFHTNDPISTLQNNWNNDSCLPIPGARCSGDGYPVYVINATGKEDVKKGVDFARKWGVRLGVRGTGHDYLGRSSAPNSLSIWTHHMRGLSFHDEFQPEGCGFSIEGHAITAAAGTQMLELDEQAHLRDLTIVSGGAGTVGVGGFLMGGGHGALSSTYGMGADQVLQIEMVAPGGEILTANECQHQDLFWAMRGGGGSTFGVMTSVTIKAFPSTEIHTVSVILAPVRGADSFWEVVAEILSRFPSLDDSGISAYTFISPNFVSTELNITSPVHAFRGLFILPRLHPENTSDSLTTTIKQLFADATADYPWQLWTYTKPKSYQDFWALYQVINGPRDGGDDKILGSRLLDANALTGNLTALAEAYRKATPVDSEMGVFLVGGKGVHNVKPRGGSNAVNPAWRKARVHSVFGLGWPPFDEEKRLEQLKHTNSYIEALRNLAPGMGAYANEALPDEPDWQHAFWGSNYERLLEIKRKYDPWDVLWCHPCVGNENWEVIDNVLCKV